MARKRRKTYPWAELSLAFDLHDRRELALPSATRAGVFAARWWKRERLNYLLRRLMVTVLGTGLVTGLIVVLLLVVAEYEFRSHSETIETLKSAMLTLVGVLAAATIGVLLLQVLAGLLCLKPRLQARRAMLLHAERLRRNQRAIPAPLPGATRALLVARLGGTSLEQEKRGPMVLLAFFIGCLILVAFPLTRTNLPFAACMTPVVLLVFVGISAAIAQRSTSVLAMGLDKALEKGECPMCGYQVFTPETPSLRRCPECGMRHPAARPVNQPPRLRTWERAVWERLTGRR